MRVCVSVQLWLCVEMSKYILISFSRLLFTLFAFPLNSHSLARWLCVTYLNLCLIQSHLHTQREKRTYTRTHAYTTNESKLKTNHGTAVVVVVDGFDVYGSFSIVYNKISCFSLICVFAFIVEFLNSAVSHCLT